MDDYRKEEEPLSAGARTAKTGESGTKRAGGTGSFFFRPGAASDETVDNPRRSSGNQAEEAMGEPNQTVYNPRRSSGNPAEEAMGEPNQTVYNPRRSPDNPAEEAMGDGNEEFYLAAGEKVFGKYTVAGPLVGSGKGHYGKKAIYRVKDSTGGRHILKVYFDKTNTAFPYITKNITVFEARGEVEGFFATVEPYGEPAIDKSRYGCMTEEEIRGCLANIEPLLVQAHEQWGIVLIDFKTEHILKKEHGGWFLTDFDISMERVDITSGRTHFLRDPQGFTYYYAAPELLNAQVAMISPVADYYSLGQVLVELLTGKTLFSDCKSADEIILRQDDVHFLLGKRLEERHLSISADLRHLLEGLLAISRDTRFGKNEVLQYIHRGTVREPKIEVQPKKTSGYEHYVIFEGAPYYSRETLFEAMLLNPDEGIKYITNGSIMFDRKDATWYTAVQDLRGKLRKEKDRGMQLFYFYHFAAGVVGMGKDNPAFYGCGQQYADINAFGRDLLQSMRNDADSQVMTPVMSQTGDLLDARAFSTYAWALNLPEDNPSFYEGLQKFESDYHKHLGGTLRQYKEMLFRLAFYLIPPKERKLRLFGEEFGNMKKLTMHMSELTGSDLQRDCRACIRSPEYQGWKAVVN